MPLAVETKSRSQPNTWLEIRLSRLRHNLRTIKAAAPHSEVIAVVKANAYGHGLLEIAHALTGQVSYFGVSSLREALILRGHEIGTPVLIFGRLLSDELPLALTEGITLSVSSLEEAREISSISNSLGHKTPIHIKVDTGMGRLGIPLRQALSDIEAINKLEGLVLEGLYTHFPTAEKDDGFTQYQLQGFSLLIETLSKKGITFRYRHASNSAGILKADQSILNMIRPGLMLYGIYPDASLANLANITPILTLKSRLILVKILKAGESTGYGRDFIAQELTHIGILPIGYSHGYPFTASNRAYVLLRGQKYPVAGRISMDYLTVNFGNTAARIGEEVTLIGTEKEQNVRAEDLASWAGTIPYEIVTRFIPSLPRFYT